MRRHITSLVVWAVAGSGMAAPAWSAEVDITRRWTLETESSLSSSRWVESRSDGTTLLREQGLVQGLMLGGSFRPTPGWSVGLHHTRRRGERDYEGVTNVGQAVSTDVGLGETVWDGRIQRAWGPWRLGTRLEHHEVRRVINGVGPILGLDERYQWRSAVLEFGWASMRRSGWQFWAQGALGRHLGGTVSLDLPGAEPLRLQTSRGPVHRLGLGVNWMPSPAEARRSGGIQTLSLGAETEAFSWTAGAEGAVVRGGLVTGAARQPQTQARRNGLVLGVAWAL